MKKLLILIACLSVVFAEGHVYVCDVTDDGAGTATFTICADTDELIGGYQFTLDAGADFTITGSDVGSDAASVGIANYGGGGNLILAFAISGLPESGDDFDYWTEGSELQIATFTGTYANNGVTSIMPDFGSTGALSTAGGANIVTEVSMSSWDAGNSTASLEGDLPAQYMLSDNYPNPFNPTTTIGYNVELAGNVSIVIYDMTGRQVKELVNDYKSPLVGAQYSAIWDATNDAGSLVSAGTYLCRMISSDFVSTNKMTLMK